MAFPRRRDDEQLTITGPQRPIASQDSSLEVELRPAAQGEPAGGPQQATLEHRHRLAVSLAAGHEVPVAGERPYLP